MRIDLVTTTAQFSALKAQWDELLQRSQSRSVFLTHEWLYTWWRHFGEGSRLCILVASEGSRVAGIAPLMVSSWEGFRHCGLIGSDTVDFVDLLIEGSEHQELVVTAMVDTLLSLPGSDFFQFNRFDGGSTNYALLKSAWQKHPEVRTVCRPFGTAPYVTIDSEWDEYLGSLKNRFVKDSERQVRRLTEDFGPITYRSASDSAEVAEWMDLLTQQHVIRRRETKGDYSIFEDERLAAFYQDLAQRLFSAGYLDLQAMVVGDQLGALNFGMKYEGAYYYLIPTFDASFGRYSVGRLLLLHLIKESFAQHLQRFDLLLGDESYKFEVATGSRRLYSIAAYPRTVRGRLAYGWFNQLRQHLRESPRAKSLIPALRRAGILRRFS